MRVAVAIIFDEQQRVLITRRPEDAPYGAGLWEFPGGKQEMNESSDAALIREVKEEVGLDVLHHDFLGEIRHDYAQHSVSLFVYCVRSYLGEAIACESQMDLRWVDMANLCDFEFPAANEAIIRLLNTSLLHN